VTEMLCRDCDAIVLFVTPDCDEQDCGDLMCVLCGAAVTVGGLLVAEPTARPVRRTAAA
jgi:hypothetical protein